MFFVDLDDVLGIGCGEHIKRSSVLDLLGELRGGSETEYRMNPRLRLESRSHLLKYVRQICGCSHCDFSFLGRRRRGAAESGGQEQTSEQRIERSLLHVLYIRQWSVRTQSGAAES